MTLDELKPGQKATITGITSHGPVAQRLMSMGIIEGHQITITRRALGGDPLEVDLMGYSLSLRKSEASCIAVTPDSTR